MQMLLLTLCIGADISGGAVKPMTYADFLARVEKLQPGQTLTLTVGMPGENRCDDAKTFGIDAGRYTCWYDGFAPKMQRIAPPATINANAISSPYTLGSPCANGRCPTPPRR